MEGKRRVSTGIPGFDQVIDQFRLGDNVVWQVESLEDYRRVVQPYIRQAVRDGRKLVYIRFGSHEPVISEEDMGAVSLEWINAQKGFEHFATKVHRLITDYGKEAFYVFDCLTDLLKFWYSDLMIGNFFRVTCPYLFELETIAYFALIRDSHTSDTINRIRETTQLLLEVYDVDGNFYVHPVKVWQRYSKTMFLPHLITHDTAQCITSSAEAAALFSRYGLEDEKMDYWDVTFQRAYQALSGSEERREERKKLLLKLLIGDDTKIYTLCCRFFSLRDLVNIKSREIGTGRIGGKAVGMLLARKIVEQDKERRFAPYLEMHDSFYLGADIFYTYIVHNDCWKLRTKQKTREGYYRYAPELKERILHGTFPEMIKNQFRKMLEYYGQSPIIVRSSSLLEDNFGNAFAGKYDSVFCVNQGTPEERYEAFEHAVRTVYASTMNQDALNYRMNRGLFEQDEQMALLVQRVSGDYYGTDFFPHIAGVGNSSNLYVWNSDIDMSAGMLRLVFGLGTRAVDRVVGDYPRIVCLDDPNRKPLVDYQNVRKFSQHYVDLLDLEHNTWTHKGTDQILNMNLKADKKLFASKDFETMRRLRERGDYRNFYIVDFPHLLQKTDFPQKMREILKLLSDTYEYPVDIEFTANFKEDGSYRINLLQCRPLQTTGLGRNVTLPELKDEKDCLFFSQGNFMGGNVRLPVNYVIYVDVKPYLALNEQERYEVARTVGCLNEKLKDEHTLLIGPGRWGTTTTSLGVPVHFTELCHMTAICEVSCKEEGLMPELSYGSHFFQDLVESDVFYVALFKGEKGVIFQEEQILEKPNLLKELTDEKFSQVIHVIKTEGMELYSDTIHQKVLCR